MSRTDGRVRWVRSLPRYENEKKKSDAIAVTLQPREKTMTDEEIDAVGKKIVAEVTKRTGGTLRG